MSATIKLTKKQKKGIAFRERKKGRGKDGTGAYSAEDNDVPVVEDQDALAAEGLSVEMEMEMEEDGQGRKQKQKQKQDKNKKSTWDAKTAGSGGGDQAQGNAKCKGKGKGKTDSDEGDTEPSGESRKRKREDADVDVDVDVDEPECAEDEPPGAKRTKCVGDDAAESAQDTKVTATSKSKSKQKQKQRFILFLGNIKYTTTRDAISKHFAACDPPPTIRLLTPKSTSGKPTNKSKGCAFLEFTHRNALQQGLKLHQTELDGRMINVELTAGGGGKSESRLGKVRERNKQLLGQRKEKIEKLAASDASAIPTMPDKPQRYSATSGIKQAPSKRRTWTVGDVEDEETHRGGKKHSKRSRSKPSGKMWGTGVNAIPVG